MAEERTIKILRIIARMNVGGPAVQITNVLNGLPSEEFQQRLYFGTCEAGEAEFISEIENKSVLHRIPGFRKSVRGFSEIGVLWHLIKEIREFKPDVIHTHTAKAGLIGRLAAILSRSRAKRVHTFHGHILYGYFNPTVSSLYAAVERILAVFTDAIVSVGPQVKADLLKFRIGKPTKHRVIFPGITIGPRIPKNQAWQSLKIEPKKFNIAFIGRFTTIKRVDRLVELARLCKQQGLDVQFVLAGDGPELEKFRDIAKVENLSMIFLGWRSDIELILSASDLLILVSDNEGTPIASIQASLLGVPTLATKVGSLSDIVIHEKTGLLTSIEVDDIFLSLKRLFLDEHLLRGLGDQAKVFAEKEFSLTRFLLDYRELYKSLTR